MMLLRKVMKMDMDALGTHRQRTIGISTEILKLSIRVIVTIPHPNDFI